MPERPPLLVVVGPTAVGKSDLAIRLAEELDGEVVSADSRQVYRGLDIGSGKVSPDDRRRVPHHLLDVADPSETYTVAEYRTAARRAIRDIHRRARLPIVVGGSGLYVQAALEELAIPPVPPRVDRRQVLGDWPAERLLERLRELEPGAARRVDVGNPRRIIRAIEVAESGGATTVRSSGRGYDSLPIGLTASPAILTERINRRLDERLAAGLVDEVRALRRAGLPWRRLHDLGLEYRRVGEFLREAIPYDQFVERLRLDIRRYAKRQVTWFKKRPAGIRWFENPEAAFRFAVTNAPRTRETVG